MQLSDHFSYSKLARFVLPSVVMMVFTSIYGVVDGLFVSNFVGKIAFAAINLIMPFLMILGAVGFMIGAGGTALVAKTLGEGNKNTANRYFSMMVYFTIICGIAFSAVGFIFIRPISYKLGATDEMINECVLYGRIILIFNTAFMLQNVFQSFFIAAERPKLGLAVTVSAGASNMILDAIFIVVFKWGVAGAAFATGISQCVGGISPLIYFLSSNDSPLHLRTTKFEFKPLFKACTNGSSELMSNISMSLVSIVYNFQLLKFAGEDGVAAYGVLMYVNFIFIAIFIGYSIGSAPIISYNYGSQNHTEQKNIIKKSIIIMVFSGIALTILAEIMAIPLSRVFVGYDDRLCDITVRAFRIFSISFILTGLNIFASSFFTALNNGLISAIVSFMRTLVFQMLAVILLPIYFGIDGIWFSITVAEMCSLIISVVFFFTKRKEYNY